MSAVPQSSKILVTGANGFVGGWVVKSLLERGFQVRGTVRDTKKGDYLRDFFKDHSGKFEYVIVKDITVEGAFDEAVQGVQGVAHVAAVLRNVEDPKDIIDPALKGTISILNSIKSKGSDIKRIVLTSSAVAAYQPHPEVPSYTYTDADWNDDAVKQTELHGAKTSPTWIKYFAAKTLAEQEFWKFFKEAKGLTFDGVAINPPWSFGPILYDVSSVEGLNFSMESFSGWIKYLETAKSTEGFSNFIGNLSDVRDVALAHVEALLRDEAGGKRFMLSSKGFAFQDFLDAINTADPPLPVNVSKGNPGKTFVPLILDSSKVKEILGITLTPWEKTVIDSVLTLKERGW